MVLCYSHVSLVTSRFHKTNLSLLQLGVFISCLCYTIPPSCMLFTLNNVTHLNQCSVVSMMLSADGVSQGWQTFSVKGQIINTLSFAGHAISVAAVQLCHGSSHRQFVNE